MLVATFLVRKAGVCQVVWERRPEIQVSMVPLESEQEGYLAS